MSSGKSVLALLMLSALAIGCGKDEPENKPVRTQREKDSILARSTIPGGKAVGKAMRVADSAEARQNRIMDTTQETP